MESVRIVDKSSGATLAAEFIKNISYTCVLESTDQVDVFAYIAVNKRLVRSRAGSRAMPRI